jgi:hypothetical protein
VDLSEFEWKNRVFCSKEKLYSIYPHVDVETKEYITTNKSIDLQRYHHFHSL